MSKNGLPEGSRKAPMYTIRVKNQGFNDCKMVSNQGHKISSLGMIFLHLEIVSDQTHLIQNPAHYYQKVVDVL